MLDLERILALIVFSLIPLGAVVHAATPHDTDQHALGILKKMTLDEKLDYIGGVNNFFIRGIERLGLPEFRMAG